MAKERPGALLARRAHTMRQWSLNARSKRQPGHFFKEMYSALEEPRSTAARRTVQPGGARIL